MSSDSDTTGHEHLQAENAELRASLLEMKGEVEKLAEMLRVAPKMDEGVAAPNFNVFEHDGRWYVQRANGSMAGELLGYDTEALAIDCSHRIYRSESAPAVRAAVQAVRVEIAAGLRERAKAHEASRNNALEDNLFDAALMHDVARFTCESAAWKLSGDDREPAAMMDLADRIRAHERTRWSEEMITQARGSEGGPDPYVKHWGIATRGWADRLRTNDPMREPGPPAAPIIVCKLVEIAVQKHGVELVVELPLGEAQKTGARLYQTIGIVIDPPEAT